MIAVQVDLFRYVYIIYTHFRYLYTRTISLIICRRKLN